MHCAKCGYNNITSARVCAKCGAPLMPAPKRPARARGERKTVQLPSYGAAHEKAQRSKPQTREENERPWEARIPSRDRRTSQAEEHVARNDEQAIQGEEQAARSENRATRYEERIARREEQVAQAAEHEQAPDEQVRAERVQSEHVDQEEPFEQAQVAKAQAEQAQNEQLEIGQAETVEEAEEAEDENLQKYRGRFATHVPVKKRSQANNESSRKSGRAAAAAVSSLASEAGAIKTTSKHETSSQNIEDTPRTDTPETHPAQSSQRVQENAPGTEAVRENASLKSLHPKTEPSRPTDNEQNARQNKGEQQATEQITEKISVESMRGKDDIPDASKAATIVIPATAATAGAATDATVKMTSLEGGAGRQARGTSAPKQAANIANAAQSDNPTIVVNRTSPTQRHAPKKEKNTGKKALGVVAVIALLACLGIGGWYFTHGTSPKSTVSFDTNGGSSISQQYIPENGQLQQPMSPTREGYKFDGWYLDASYNEPAKFPLTITKDTTLYAKWVPESQTDTSTSASSSPSPSTSNSVASNPGDSTVSGVVSGGGASGVATSSGGSSDDGYASGGSGSGGSEGGSDGSGDGSGGGSGGGGAASDTGDVTTSVSVIAADGATLSGEVHLHNGYVIPDSSERVYSIDELRALNLSDADLCIAWNEPFARLGHDFDNPGLQNYFDNRSWYSNSFRKASLQPNSAAEINVANLQELARENASSAAWLNLRTY